MTERINPVRLAFGSLLVLLAGLAGCVAVGAIAYKLSPPETTPAKYKLGLDPAVIFVENSRNPAEAELDAIQVSALLREDMIKHKSAVLVDANAVQRLRDDNPAGFAKMSITEVGRRVSAKQVVYVDLVRVGLEVDAGDQMVRGHVETLVRVVDVRTGVNRWPTDMQQGYPIGFETPFISITPQMTEGDIRRRLHDQLVLTAGRLFRDWQAETDHLK